MATEFVSSTRVTRFVEFEIIATICLEHLKGYFVVKGFIMIGVTIYAILAELQSSAVI